MGEIKGQGHIVHPLSNRSTSCCFTSIGTTIPEIISIVVDLEKTHPKFEKNNRQKVYVNTTVAVVLAPCVARSTTDTVLAILQMQKQILVFHKDGFELPAPSHYREGIRNKNYLWFLILIQRTNGNSIWWRHDMVIWRCFSHFWSFNVMGFHRYDKGTVIRIFDVSLIVGLNKLPIKTVDLLSSCDGMMCLHCNSISTYPNLIFCSGITLFP